MSTKLVRILDFHERDIRNVEYSNDIGRDFVPFYLFTKSVLRNSDFISAINESLPSAEKSGDVIEAEFVRPLCDEIRIKLRDVAQNCWNQGWFDLNNKDFASKYGDQYSIQELLMGILRQRSLMPDPFYDLRFLISFLGAAVNGILWRNLGTFIVNESNPQMKANLEREKTKLEGAGAALKSWAEDEAKKVQSAITTARGLTFHDATEFLKTLEVHFDEVKEGCRHGRPDHPEFLTVDRWKWIKSETLRMILSLKSFLVDRHSIQGTVGRYCALAERFGKGPLIRDLVANPSQKEKVCQEHLDHYLFSSGITPITHAEAVHGRWETLETDVKQDLSDLYGTSESHHPAVLFELKQSLANVPLSESDLKKIFASAAAQAKSYKDYIESVHRKEATCYIVIYYDGSNRWSYRVSPSLEVKPILIYLGNEVASRIKGTIEF